VALEGVGIGQAALELATKYANERVVFDRPIGQNQAVAHPPADSWIRLESARLTARLYDDHQNCGKEAAAAKYLGAEAGFDACDRAMSRHGGYDYAKGLGRPRHPCGTSPRTTSGTWRGRRAVRRRR
jgi:acyl-CoA dehydrogenase